MSILAKWLHVGFISSAMWFSLCYTPNTNSLIYAFHVEHKYKDYFKNKIYFFSELIFFNKCIFLSLHFYSFSFWYWQHDILRIGIWSIFRARKRHQMPQRDVGSNTCHPHGVHLHSDVFYFLEQRGIYIDCK